MELSGLFFTCYKVMFVKVGILSSLLFFLFSGLNHFSPVLCPISFFHKHLSCFSLHGLGPKGGIGVLVYIQPTTFSTSAPIHHHGDTSTSTSLYVQHGVLSLSKVLSSPSMVHDHTFAATWGVVGGCCFYEGKGPLVRSWGEC